MYMKYRCNYTSVCIYVNISTHNHLCHLGMKAKIKESKKGNCELPGRV